MIYLGLILWLYIKSGCKVNIISYLFSKNFSYEATQQFRLRIVLGGEPALGFMLTG